MTKTPVPGIPGRPPGFKKRGRPPKERHPINQLELQLKARAYTDLALDTLVDLCKNGSDIARQKSASELLDRGWGKTQAPPVEKTQPNTQIKIMFAEPPPPTIDGRVEPRAIATWSRTTPDEADIPETSFDDAAD